MRQASSAPSAQHTVTRDEQWVFNLRLIGTPLFRNIKPIRHRLGRQFKVFSLMREQGNPSPGALWCSQQCGY